jgi:hypothetical protein
MSNPPAGWYPDPKMPVTLFFCDDTVWSPTAVEAMHQAADVEGGDD